MRAATGRPDPTRRRSTADAPDRPPAALALLLAAPLSAAGQTPPAPAAAPPDEITLERIMAHPDWLGAPPEEPYWADDGRAVYFRRKRAGEDIRDLWRIDLAGCKPGAVCTPRKVEPQEVLGKADAPGGAWSEDRRRKVYAREGDVFLKDVTTGAIRQLTRTGEEESEPRFQWATGRWPTAAVGRAAPTSCATWLRASRASRPSCAWRRTRLRRAHSSPARRTRSCSPSTSGAFRPCASARRGRTGAREQQRRRAARRSVAPAAALVPG